MTEVKRITRSFPHPDGRIFTVSMPVSYWRGLQWLTEDRGITAGTIIHCMDRQNSQQDPSEAFMEFIASALQTAREKEREGESA